MKKFEVMCRAYVEMLMLTGRDTTENFDKIIVVVLTAGCIGNRKSSLNPQLLHYILTLKLSQSLIEPSFSGWLQTTYLLNGVEKQVMAVVQITRLLGLNEDHFS